MGTRGQRYSPSTKINTANVANLVPVWSFSFGGEKQRGQESQPIIHNGKMFVTGSYSRLFALDAKAGSKLWQYEHGLPEGIMPCRDVVNRGGRSMTTWPFLEHLTQHVGVQAAQACRSRGKLSVFHLRKARFGGFFTSDATEDFKRTADRPERKRQSFAWACNHASCSAVLALSKSNICTCRATAS